MNKKLTPIPRRLKEAREAAGLSQKKLGIVTGIDEFSASARMNQYETGKHTPDFSMITRLAKTLKLPAPYFYTENDELAEIIAIFNSLNKKDKQTVVAFLKSEIKQYNKTSAPMKESQNKKGNRGST